MAGWSGITMTAAAFSIDAFSRPALGNADVREIRY
jgi:hypothetical protein